MFIFDWRNRSKVVESALVNVVCVLAKIGTTFNRPAKNMFLNGEGALICANVDFGKGKA
jgi:hypothetical protein